MSKRSRHIGRPATDETGNRYGRLVVVCRVEPRPKGAFWLCICDCGQSKVASGANLRSGTVASCGCLKREVSLENGKSTRKHGFFGTPLYSVWADMKDRCGNPRSHGWRNYGGRGIQVCDAWRADPQVFIEWALNNGYRQGLYIDRIDNDGNYEPHNCRFVTAAESVANRRNTVRLTVNGETKTMADWVRDGRCAVTYGTLNKRRKRDTGWDPEAAITTPSLKQKRGK